MPGSSPGSGGRSSRGPSTGGPARPAPRSTAAHVFVADLSSPALSDDDLHHLLRVLRLRPGESVGVSDGRGGWRACRIDGAGELGAEGREETEEAPWPPVTVGLSVPKGDRADWAVQKLTEVGVDRIVPLVTERSVVRPGGDRAIRQVTRWRAIARSAAMQSRRLWLPDVTAPATLDELLGGSGADPVAAGLPAAGPPVARPGAGSVTGVVALAEPGGPAPSLDHPTVLVGPEGGWSEAERATAPATVGLGQTVLRTETAAVVAGCLLVALRSGLVGEADRRPVLPAG